MDGGFYKEQSSYKSKKIQAYNEDGSSINIFLSSQSERKEENSEFGNFVDESDEFKSSISLFDNIHFLSYSTPYPETEATGLFINTNQGKITAEIKNSKLESSDYSNYINANGKIEIPEPQSTLKINQTEWNIDKIDKYDRLSNNLIVRVFYLKDNGLNTKTNKRLEITIKGKNIIGIKYIDPQTGIQKSCGSDSLISCTGLILSANLNTITFNQTIIDDYKINGQLSYIIR